MSLISSAGLGAVQEMNEIVASVDTSQRINGGNPGAEQVPREPAVSKKRKPQVVIVGGGFAGIAAAKSLNGCDADVTAYGSLTASRVVEPVRSLSRNLLGINFYQTIYRALYASFSILIRLSTILRARADPESFGSKTGRISMRSFWPR